MARFYQSETEVEDRQEEDNARKALITVFAEVRTNLGHRRIGLRKRRFSLRESSNHGEQLRPKMKNPGRFTCQLYGGLSLAGIPYCALRLVY
ncbi:MAG: hypothetical protein ABSE41_14450 [Bacteroidota bacterium]|jgi:hypothetical protein